jgi:hypothetical protein
MLGLFLFAAKLVIAPTDYSQLITLHPNRLAQYENLFRKAGIPARHLRFLPDLWASERLPWEHTRHGWYGQVRL